MDKVLFSSQNTDWETPSVFFDNLNKEFNFDIDVCASSDTTKCENYFSLEDDAFLHDWTGVCYMNPPYGRDIQRWVKKAAYSAEQGATVVCLLPARTDTRWWHNYVPLAAELRLIKGRLRFKRNGCNTNIPAPFPSVIIVFKPHEGSTILRHVDRND